MDLLRRKQIPERENGFLYCCWLFFSLQAFLVTLLPKLSDWMAIRSLTPVCSHTCKEWAVSWGRTLGFYCWRVKILICITVSEIWSRHGALISQVRVTNTTLWKVHELAELQLPRKSFSSSGPFIRPPSIFTQPTIQTRLWQQRLLPTLKTSVHTHIYEMVPDTAVSSVRDYLEWICWHDTTYSHRDPAEYK